MMEEPIRRHDADPPRLARLLRDVAAPGILLVLMLVAWEVLVVVLNVKAFILPRPSQVVVDLVRNWDVYQPNFIFTLQNVLLGFALAFVVAMLLGFIVAHSTIAKRSIYPILVASQTVPVIAVAPLFIIWFGYGILPKVITTALICFFPLTVTTIAGYMSVDPDQKTLFTAYRASRWNTFSKLSFPAALPHIMSGLKVSVTLSVIGGVIGEWIGSEAGLGFLIIQASSQIQTVRVFGAITILSIMGIALFVVASLVERWITPWIVRA